MHWNNNNNNNRQIEKSSIRYWRYLYNKKSTKIKSSKKFKHDALKRIRFIHHKNGKWPRYVILTIAIVKVVLLDISNYYQTISNQRYTKDTNFINSNQLQQLVSLNFVIQLINMYSIQVQKNQPMSKQ